MKVVLFCGGLGTRLREYSETIPKPLVDIGYRPIMWHLMKYYAHFGHNEFILCLGYRGDLIKEYFLKYNEWLSNDFSLADGGRTMHLYNQDIVLEGMLPSRWKEVAELYAGCVSGAVQKEEYLSMIKEAGFTNINLQKEKAIIIPGDILSNYLSEEEIKIYKEGNTKITSITVYAEKPAKDERNCCEPGSGCC